MTFSEFCESVVGFKLPEWQEAFLNEIDLRVKRGEKLHYILARGMTKYDPLAFVVVLYSEFQRYERN